MVLARLHDWNLSPAEARALQAELACRVRAELPIPDWHTIAAADVSHRRGDPLLHAGVVVLKRGSFEVIERAAVSAPATFPYVPGLLSFREAPPVLEAFRQLKTKPDVVLCDGQGIAHPRRLGLAAHLGLWLDVPTIGCAKSRLHGEFNEPATDRGASSPLTDSGETIGAVLRTRARVKPLFVSVGHRCDLASAIAVVLETAPRTRLPEPARKAHAFVNETRRARSQT